MLKAYHQQGVLNPLGVLASCQAEVSRGRDNSLLGAVGRRHVTLDHTTSSCVFVLVNRSSVLFLVELSSSTFQRDGAGTRKFADGFIAVLSD
ncbi:hypothetical protein EVAR_79299_1 [Eumeta japonica]|uniref:Uncharacterized protein n=1 Tax=Eumeta variegata TaxID=151549 RepID=A0A4C1THQ0_EUMVA|nr:hypothetical protein EVAR_79299_1 [Eumeta japonica]